MTNSAPKAPGRSAALSLWTRLTFIAIVGSFALTWMLVGLLKLTQD